MCRRFGALTVGVMGRRLGWTWSALVSAVIGAGVVLTVHRGRQWADGTPCAFPDGCPGADTTLHRLAVLTLAVPLVALAILIATRVRRPWLVVMTAFTLQAAAMVVVEHADGFWLPLWLDVLIGAASWCAAAASVSRW